MSQGLGLTYSWGNPKVSNVSRVKMFKVDLLSTKIRGIHMSEWLVVTYIAQLCTVSLSGISSSSNVNSWHWYFGHHMLKHVWCDWCVHKGLSKYAKKPLYIARTSTTNPWFNKPKIETCAYVLDNYSIMNKWDFLIATSKILFSFLCSYSPTFLYATISMSSSIIFSFPFPSGWR